MNLITLEHAKSQLGVLDDTEDAHIQRLINAAIARVEYATLRDIYATRTDVPETDLDPIVLDELKETHHASLQQAALLALSSLHSMREADTTQALKENPAFNAQLTGFKRVYIG